MTRTRQVILNILTGVFGKFANIIMQFVSRTIFISILGVTYLGVYGLFSEVLLVLSLAELGVGAAIVYNLYKPIAEGNERRMKALMNLYGKAYTSIGTFILIVGVALTPLIPFIIKSENPIPDIKLIYVLFVISSGSSYFFIYRSAFLSANQKEYIYTTIRVIFNFIQIATQLLVLALTKSFIWYLVTKIVIDIIKNIYVSHVTLNMYPFLRHVKDEQLTKVEVSKIFRDVRALVIYKFSRVMVNSTDNIIISAFVGIIQTGLYSNYATILNHVVQVINTIVYSLDASIGNYNAVETDENKYKMFRKTSFMMNWLYGLSTSCLFILFNPFITLWIGQDFLFEKYVVLIICLNFYITGTQNIVWSFRQTMGVFIYGRFKPLVSVAVNLIFSIILARQLGLIGVLLGTTITRVFVDAWFDPYMLHKHGFHNSVFQYYKRYLGHFSMTVFIVGLTYIISMWYNDGSVIAFLWKMLSCITIPNIIYYIVYRKSMEMGYFKGKFEDVFAKFLRKEK